jgi:acetylornithine/succinyldiaminopimelate/putrescine aminotransferase
MLSTRQLFLQHVAQTSDISPLLDFVRGEGIYLYDSDGKAYLDMISGISVSSIGHSNPRVIQAVKDQVDQHMHLMVYGEFAVGPQARLAEKLLETLPERLDNVYFVSSGAEATEGALKLAKRYTGRSEIVHFENAYHGSTMGALSVLGSEYFKSAFRPLIPDARQLPYGHLPSIEQISCRTAAVIMETVQAESGVTPPSIEYMQALRRRCDETGALLILDEIQAGMGRTGKTWAFEHFGIEPDILLSAKALGAGMPLGAFIAPKEIMQSLIENPILGHITTFGGNPVSCAAGLAGLNEILENDWLEKVKEKEQLFVELLQHPAIKVFKHFGFLMAVEFEDFETNKAVIDACMKRRLITDWFLFADNCLRLSPPLIITEEQIKEACQIIIDAIEDVQAK